MAQPTQNKNFKPGQMTAEQFEQFMQYIPHTWLEQHNIARTSFLAVCSMLVRHCTFATGEDLRISQAGLVDESGCSHNTVRKVIDFLTNSVGVLQVVDLQRRAGSPSKNYRLFLSSNVQTVLTNKDRGPKAASTKKKRVPLTELVDTSSVSVDTLTERVDTLTERVDNNKVYKVNKRDSRFTPAPDSSLSAQEPSDEEREKEEVDFDSAWNKYLASSSGDEFARLFS